MSAMRSFLHRFDDLPAFHAAVIVLTMLAAMLMSTGVFVLILAVRIFLDVARGIVHASENLPSSLLRSTMHHAWDLSLVGLALAFSSSEPLISMLFPVGSLARGMAVLIRGFGMVLPRAGILRHSFLPDTQNTLGRAAVVGVCALVFMTVSVMTHPQLAWRAAAQALALWL